ncbi:CopD family protein [Cryobacterium sp. PH31-O1]|uniref:copper resistance CopC/CopD family protein n=1 Tax=Cryobacterium sp. PH31-O1 TaxID=3046306 RepID=UPI0024B9DAC9|nr:CopD family protein [Cryobacterium sp. PH31-O1]MDJ0339067.1 CopD family protein [Cryobacterium sp. PH31-O1]
MSTITAHWLQDPKSPAGAPRVRRLLGLVLITMTLALTMALGLPPAPASAHAELLFTMPAEGAVLAQWASSVELTFDEPVFLVADGFQLYDGSGLAGWFDSSSVARHSRLTAKRRRCRRCPDPEQVLHLAGGLVVLLGVTGTILGVVIVGSVPTLVGGAYGQLLLVKLGLVAVIGALATWNRFGLVPHLARGDATGRAWHRLAVAIRFEVIGVVLVIGVTSALTLQNPRQPTPRLRRERRRPRCPLPLGCRCSPSSAPAT